jgi:hypothetical protein
MALAEKSFIKEGNCEERATIKKSFLTTIQLKWDSADLSYQEKGQPQKRLLINHPH